MRGLVLALLIGTTAATPALAQFAPEQRRGQREQARLERAERLERAAQRRAQAGESDLAPVDEQQPSRPAIDRAIERGRASTAAEQPRPRLDQRRGGSPDSVANWRREQREQMRAGRPGELGERLARRRVTPPAEARPDRPAPAPRTAARRSGWPRWQSSWHDDRRYNWRDHRRRYGSLYRLGYYFDPFGWGYRRYGIGWRLWPSYYGSSYWLSDPFMYRLPYAPSPYKWVRYWDDALLVDTFTGEVVDVAHDFFW